MNRPIPSEALLHCLRAVEAKAGLGDSAHWRHRHFEHLSDQIRKTTGATLSPVTLKRIWGKVRYDSSPATTTLDILVHFIGYENWIDYERRLGAVPPPAHREMKYGKPSPRPTSIPRWLVYGLLLAVAPALILSLGQRSDPVRYDLANFDFEPLSHGMPNTVIFTYDVAGSRADSVFLQQSWDPRLRHRLPLEGERFNATYYYPGVYMAKLILNDSTVAEKELSIHSEGWLGTIEKEPAPFYFSGEDIRQTASIQLAADQLWNKGYDPNGDIPYTSLHLVGEFEGVAGDDFVLETRFRNTFGQGSAICRKTQIRLLGGDTPIIIPFSIKGCVAELSLYTPDEKISGSRADLSAFGLPFTDWVDLRVQVQDRQLEIYVNGTPAYADQLDRIPQRLSGIQYRFHGTGAVQSLSLFSDGKLHYRWPENTPE